VYQVDEGMLGRKAFADCIAQHMPYLKRAVYNLTRGDQVAENIIQQTVRKALMHADQFRFDSTLNTWLIAIAVNEIRQVYRSSWRARAVPLITENLNVEQCALIESLMTVARRRSATLLSGARFPASHGNIEVS
jgi:DNA-directed RNA polymerase specialized sigma24 family protein